MIAPYLFAATGIASGWIILKYNIAFIRLEKNLVRAFREEGKAWEFATDFAFRRALFKDPNSILLASDSEKIAAAKKTLIAQRVRLSGSIKAAVITALVGFLVMIAASMGEFYLRSS